MDKRLEMLINLSRQLADPAYDLTILGEGNTSTTCDDGTFWVKASGSQLATIDENGFSRVRADAILSLLDKSDLDDAGIAEGLKSALIEKDMRKPSVETFMHALCLAEAGVQWVGHTHALSVISILCSRQGAEPFKQHIFPDAIVVCGETPAIVPYVDPGLPLSRAVRVELRRYTDTYGRAPRLLLMENHGMVALGSQPSDVINITMMTDKWARAILGANIMGGPRYLPDEHVQRIETREDEAYRRKEIAAKS